MKNFKFSEKPGRSWASAIQLCYKGNIYNRTLKQTTKNHLAHTAKM